MYFSQLLLYKVFGGIKTIYFYTDSVCGFPPIVRTQYVPVGLGFYQAHPGIQKKTPPCDDEVGIPQLVILYDSSDR